MLLAKAGPTVTVSVPNWKYSWLAAWNFRLIVLALPPASTGAPALRIQIRGPMFMLPPERAMSAFCLIQTVATKEVMVPKPRVELLDIKPMGPVPVAVTAPGLLPPG